jgi:hypothetical protein
MREGKRQTPSGPMRENWPATHVSGAQKKLGSMQTVSTSATSLTLSPSRQGSCTRSLLDSNDMSYLLAFRGQRTETHPKSR